MGEAIDGHAVCGRNDTKSVTVDVEADLFERLAALPSPGAPRSRAFTHIEDKALLAFWATRRQEDVARIMGRGIGALRKRYRELMEGVRK